MGKSDDKCKFPLNVSFECLNISCLRLCTALRDPERASYVVSFTLDTVHDFFATKLCHAKGGFYKERIKSGGLAVAVFTIAISTVLVGRGEL